MDKKIGFYLYMLSQPRGAGFLELQWTSRLPRLCCALLLGIFLGGTASASGLILNEANAVSSGNFLNGGSVSADLDGGLAADLSLGRVLGNGGDWFELVVVDHLVDLRGWTFEIWVEGLLNTTLVLSQDPLWTQLQAGTLITVSEDQPEDVSYDPNSGDWWINVRADDDATGTYITATAFPVNSDDWQLVIRDASGAWQFGPSGEGLSGTGAVNSRETFHLEENPWIYIAGNSNCYDDADNYSSFGLPNVWSGGAKTQDFGPLRNGTAPSSQCEGDDLTPLGFDPDRILDIEVVMDPADYDALRKQQRTIMETFGGRCGDAPAPDPYTFFHADVTVDGTTLTDVGIRKKGFFGSVSRDKPAFKIDFTEYGGEVKVYGMDRMTLNNLQQDPSLLDQCLGYGLFRAAGLPASRCNFAHVKVNGESLGIYTNVESIKDPFLVRNFGDSTGNLYEGALADFRENWIGVFEEKNNQDGSDLEAIKNALEIEDDAESLLALEDLIDLDAFVTYWALEGLIGNWDGYTGNANNFWLYKDPAKELFVFIPWSLDDIFGGDNPFGDLISQADARTVFETAALSNRLWKMPGFPEQYQARINHLIDTIWHEEDLLAEIDRMENLITPIAGDLSAPIDETRSWISGRAARVAADFAGGPPAYASALPPKTCIEIQGHLSASFTSTYADPIPVGLPSGSSFSPTSFEFGGYTSLTGAGTGFGPSYDFGTGMVALRPIGFTDFPQGLVFNIPIHEEDLWAATSEVIQVDDSLLSVLLSLNLANGSFFLTGFIVNTTLELTQADLTPGGAVAGAFSSDLGVWVPHPVPEPGSALSYGVGITALAFLARFARRRTAPDKALV